jgi:hypothetical protein
MEHKLNEFIKYYNQNIHKDNTLTYLKVLLYDDRKTMMQLILHALPNFDPKNDNLNFYTWKTCLQHPSIKGTYAIYRYAYIGECEGKLNLTGTFSDYYNVYLLTNKNIGCLCWLKPIINKILIDPSNGQMEHINIVYISPWANPYFNDGSIILH